MRASRFFISTLKEAPADAEVASHRLMLRAGMIRRLGAGIYTYMPMGLRIIRKVEAIIREEMNRAGAIELLMPVIQPAELWQESGRWEMYGPELLRIRDRHEREFIVQPTSEEVITDIARGEIHSYRQLPRNFYHIQTKFRDERRPRFGLMRGREFIMKDAYSFDRDEVGAQRSYDAMYAAYMRIFERLGLNFRPVAADTGSIGGTRSHEFQVIADTGEDEIAYSTQSEYAANIELAEAISLIERRALPVEAMAMRSTPGQVRCEDVAAFLGVPLERTVKSIVLTADVDGAPAKIWLLMLRGDHQLNEIKIGKISGPGQRFRLATEDEINATFGCPPGYLGPVGMAGRVRLIADRTVAHMSDFVCGANRAGFHYVGVNWGRDLPEPEVLDLRSVVAGDPSPDGSGRLAIQRGIEVGHVFFLGTKYSEAMQATYLDEQGRPRLMVMGCYGIGVTRLLGAAIEQNHDGRGIIWPLAMAPFGIVICPVGWGKSEAVRTASVELYDSLLASGFDVVLDDRDERPGVMFADWELIGVPLRVTVGERGLRDGRVEVQGRRDSEAVHVALGEVPKHIDARIRSMSREPDR